MKKVLFLLISVIILTACHESIEERAEREAKEYTEKFCPTPESNGTITDSLVFVKSTKTQINYMTFVGEIDNKSLIDEHADELREGMLESLRSNAQLKAYKEAGFNFEYICRSQKNPKEILLHLKYTKKDLAPKSK